MAKLAATIWRTVTQLLAHHAESACTECRGLMLSGSAEIIKRYLRRV